jgi:dipeptidyl aminopeptidase/acylaminoacyl peptidase
MSFNFLTRILTSVLSALFLASIPAFTSASGPEPGTVEESYWHIRPSWSPDGQWLAFSRAGILYKIKVDGDSLTQLPTLFGAIRPTWSPDGRRLAFVLDQLDMRGIWLYDFATSTAWQLVGFGDYPSWNPLTGELVVLDVQYGLGVCVRFDQP